MSNAKRETIADIVAEMRRFGLQATTVDFEQISPESVLYYAGRIEAAAKREREAAQSSRNTKDAMDYAATAARQFVGVDLAKDKPTFVCATIAPGNAAAMREALEEQLRYWNAHIRTRDEEEMRKRTEAALSAPARNCDRYGDEDDAFAAWHDSLNDGDVVSVRNAFAWLFAKAEGGNT